MYILKLDNEFLSGFGKFSQPGYEVSGCRLETAVNAVGHLTFTIYPDHPLYEKVSEPKRIITLLRYGENEPLFVGRVCETERGFYNEKTLVCESELSFLLDSVRTNFRSELGYSVSEWLRRLLEYHNNHGELYGDIYPNNIARKFYSGKVSSDLSFHVTRPLEEEFRGTLTTLEIINRLLLGPFGGVLKMRHEGGKNYIDWLSENDITVSSRKIELGSNLIDLNRQKKLDQLVTAVCPTGENVESGGKSEPLSIRLSDVSGYIDGTDIEQAIDSTVSDSSVLRYSDCLYSKSLVNKYGWIQREVNFPGITAVSSLTKKAIQYLRSVTECESMTITAADISSEGCGIDSFRAGDMVQVSSEVHGVLGNYMVTSTVTDFDDPSANTLEIGSESDTISSFSARGNTSYSGVTLGGSGLYDPSGAAEAALKKAKAFAETKDTETLAAAKAYTDSAGEQKADLSHTHSKSDITDFPEKLPASDVYPWAKDPQKPSYSWSEISGKPSVFPPESHSHAWSSITGKPGTFPPSYHSHGISDIDDLGGALDEKLSIASRNYVPVRYVSESMNFDTDFQLTSADPNKVIFTNTKSVTNSNSPTGIPMPYMLTVERLYVNGVSNYFRQTFTGLMNAGSESAYIVEYQRLYIYTASPFWTEWKAVASGGEDDHKVIQEYVGGADYEYPMLCSTDTEHTQSATTDKVLKLLGMTINPKAGTITAQKFKGFLEGRASSADSVEWGNVLYKPESYPPETHSHNYAASTYAGGAALSANKLNTDAGSATVPVYFSGGVPTECTYGLNKTVPADAVFTDGCIDQRNSSGNFSLPLLLGFNNDTDVNGFAWKNSKFKANPSTGELFASTFNGQIAWGNVTGKPSSYTPSSHSHSMSDISSLNTTINSLSSTLNSINTALALHKVLKPFTKSSGQPDLIVRVESYVQYNDYLWKFYLYFTNAKNIPANTETVIATTSYPPKYTVVKTGVSIWKNDNSAVHTNNATVKIKSNGDITITTPTAISGTGVNYARMNGEIFTAVNF